MFYHDLYSHKAQKIKGHQTLTECKCIFSDVRFLHFVWESPSEWWPREYLPLSLPLQCVAYQGPVWALLRSNVGVLSETLGKRRGPKCWEKIPWHKSRTWHGGKEMQGLLTIFASFIKRCNQSHNCQRVKRHQSRLLQLPSRHYHTRSHFMSFPSLALWSRMKTNYLFL